MDKIKELLKNKNILYAVIGVVAVVIVAIILIIVLSVGGKSSTGEVIDKIEKEPFEIVTTDNAGKAIEIQSILARNKINAKRRADGSKTTVFLEGGKYTNTQRDSALLLLVKSGLIDQNVGLEIFDKNDFTSTREDKRIKLARAVNGELSRLIRKMPNVDNATVLVSIPENTMFKADKKPISATVMLTVGSGVKLDTSVIKAIKSLLIGSVQDLSAENISITDSNGNVYNSLVKSIDDQIAKVQENDSYMQNKVAAQLDMLVGHGNYVVTVSTSLNQVPREITSIEYNPDGKTSITEQTFQEGLGDNSEDSSKGSDAVSVYLPNGLQNSSTTSSQNKNYSRSATETTYGVDKKHTSEYYKTGIIEKISIAVTMNADAMPPNMSMEELKAQVARAASPKVSADDVSIAFAETIDPYLASDRPVNLPVPEASGNPWWLAIVVLIAGLVVGFIFVHRKLKDASAEQEQELKKLREKTAEQEKQLVEINLQAATLTQKQSLMMQELLEQQKQLQLESKNNLNNAVSLDEVIDEVSSDIEYADSEKTMKELNSWIDKS
ncbi:hypothetical protein IJ182_05095 [bacterium]|nr:hypothetical protein [bacterium]